MQVATGRYHTLLVHDSSVYSCGSSLCGVLGHGPDTTQCVAFSQVSFPSLARVVNISAFHNHAAFVTESGEVIDTLLHGCHVVLLKNMILLLVTCCSEVFCLNRCSHVETIHHLAVGTVMWDALYFGQPK
jgi:alpha-tubulin suppressor-like RCC1 family protein